MAARHGAGGDGRHLFVHGDIRDAELVARLLSGDATELGTGRRVPPPDAILHLAAESHVDRSILGPAVGRQHPRGPRRRSRVETPRGTPTPRTGWLQ